MDKHSHEKILLDIGYGNIMLNQRLLTITS